jgi:murein DD-endopeptidase MepM/ murein hydrolase activator NlpD
MIRRRSTFLGAALGAALSALISATTVVGAVPVSGFVFPLMAPRKSSTFGNRVHPVLKVARHHGGVDLAAPSGAMIRAIKGGTVVFADPYGGYGNLVVIRHSNGFTSHYGHCEKLKVQPGQRVTAGQIIGTVGSTGRVTGPHLHFELRHNGVALDPDRYFPGLAAPGQG